MGATRAAEDDSGGFAARFGGWLTATYAARQSAAAAKCGVAPGEAWRAALAAADACGAAQARPGRPRAQRLFAARRGRTRAACAAAAVVLAALGVLRATGCLAAASWA